jgi:anthranilate phosphoribosyltransferase
MRRVQPVRRALGFRNVFHMAGPLSNPAGARAQLMGVFARDKVELVAAAMARLGVRHGMVVHGSDGLDELTLTGPTSVAEVKDGVVTEYELTPEQVGLQRAPLRALAGGETAAENAALLEAVLSGTDCATGAEARRDVVVLNAAASLVVAGVAEDLQDGVARAAAALASGAVAALLMKLRGFGQEAAAATATRVEHPTASTAARVRGGG